MQQIYDKAASLIKAEWISKFKSLEYYKIYFEKALDYNGRSNRQEFWWPMLINFIISLAFQFVSSIFGGINIIYSLINLVSFIYSIFCLIPTITVSIRRLHDVNQSGWWMLSIIAAFIIGGILSNIGNVIPFIGPLFQLVGAALPLISCIALVVMFVLNSVNTNNKYGS